MDVASSDTAVPTCDFNTFHLFVNVPHQAGAAASCAGRGHFGGFLLVTVGRAAWGADVLGFGAREEGVGAFIHSFDFGVAACQFEACSGDHAGGTGGHAHVLSGWGNGSKGGLLYASHSRDGLFGGTSGGHRDGDFAPGHVAPTIGTDRRVEAGRSGQSASGSDVGRFVSAHLSVAPQQLLDDSLVLVGQTALRCAIRKRGLQVAAGVGAVLSSGE